MKKLNSILLIDDNRADNKLHEIIIKEMGIANSIHTAESGFDALKFLKEKNQVMPDLIFLDIAMPKMNGWDFLKEYRKIDAVKKAKIVLIILTGNNPDDMIRARGNEEIMEFELKPLSKRVLNDILKKHF